mmetsp:Transcript_19904/g.19925  ORF Transcript_19904/g.19925 Transcript_19904/m.19925 type:complete len:114 (+) Transcript_19904:857-1198(+)
MLPIDNGFYIYNYCKPLCNWYNNLIEKKVKEDLPEILYPTMGFAETRGSSIKSNKEVLDKFRSGEIKLVKGTIDEIKPDGVMINGAFYKADVIIFATGFKFESLGIEQEKDGV